MTSTPDDAATTPAERAPRDSIATLTTTVLPADTNAYGNVFGGYLMALIDKTASITATRHCRQNVVTASIERVDFLAPVKLGDIIRVSTRLNHVGRASMEVGAEVHAESRLEGTEVHALSAILTFVALGSDGRPTAVPRLLATTEEERARDEAGRRRAEDRRQRL